MTIFQSKTSVSIRAFSLDSENDTRVPYSPHSPTDNRTLNIDYFKVLTIPRSDTDETLLGTKHLSNLAQSKHNDFLAEEMSIPGSPIFLDSKGNCSIDGSSIKKDGNIILIPQPSDSVEDPLNWSLLRKLLHTAILMTMTLFTSATTNLAVVAQHGLQRDIGVTVELANFAVGLLCIGIGFSSFFLAPVSFLYGRRICYIISMVFGTVGCILFAFTKTTSGFLVSQLLIGIGEAICESQVPLSFSDIYFGHQTSVVISVYVFQMAIGNYIGPLVGGFIAEGQGPGQGWRWIGGWASIFFGIMLLVTIFGCEETYFDRDHYNNSLVINENCRAEISSDDEVSINSNSSDLTILASPCKSWTDSSDALDEKSAGFLAAKQNSSDITIDIEKQIVKKSYTYWHRIRFLTPASNLVGTGFKKYVLSLGLNLRAMIFPAVIYASIVWGCQNAWMSFFSTTLLDVYVDAPYNFTSSSIGVMNLWCALGTLFGCIYSGPVSEWLIKSFTSYTAYRTNEIMRQSLDMDLKQLDTGELTADEFLMRERHRNNQKMLLGTVEPEVRLWQMALPMIFTPGGLLLFGICTEQKWNVNIAGLSLVLIGFGWGSAGDIVMSYLMDAYPKLILETMVGVSIINNSIACIFTFVCQRWIDALGTFKTYISITVISFIVLLLFVPMIFFGKTFRRKSRNYHDKCVTIRDGQTPK